MSEMPVIERSSTESALDRVLSLLQTELTPYPGRLSLVARIVLACTSVMALVMVFRIPGAALGAYYPLLLSRDSPRATLKSAKMTAGICILGTTEVILGAMLFAASPFMHFLWVAANLFAVFYLVSSLQVYDAALALGLLIANAIATWDQPMSADMKVKQTLFTLLSILLGCAISVAIEFLFARTHAADRILSAIELRLSVSQRLLHNYAEDCEIDSALTVEIHRYVMRGMGDLRDLLSHSSYEDDYKEHLAAVLALSNRLTELMEVLYRSPLPFTVADRAWCATIANNLSTINASLLQEESPVWIDLPVDATLSHPILVEIERTVDLITQSFGSDDRAVHSHLPEPGESRQIHLFADDFLKNNAHLRFALRGGFSAMACYLVYMSVGWTGLNASIATCMLTALTNTGAARHKQLMRFAGVIIGACVLGFGIQALILPQVDSLFAFALVFASVITIGAWVGTSGPRIAYCGAQIILAYDLVNLNHFGISTSLVPARDVVLGIALGIAAMWLIFDHLWATSATDTVQSLFLSSLQRISGLDERSTPGNLASTFQEFLKESRAINRDFDKLRALVDLSVFEPFPRTEEEIYIDRCVKTLMPQLRAFLLLKAGFLHYQSIAARNDQSDIALEVQHQVSATIDSIVQTVREYGQRRASLDTEAERLLLSRIRREIENPAVESQPDKAMVLRLSLSLLNLAYSLRLNIPYASNGAVPSQTQ